MQTTRARLVLATRPRIIKGTACVRSLRRALVLPLPEMCAAAPTPCSKICSPLGHLFVWHFCMHEVLQMLH